MKENNVKITGKIVEEPTYLMTARDGRKIYTSSIEAMRTSGKPDVIPIQVPEELAGEIWDHAGGRITLFGEYRSYNEKDGEQSHLRLYVFVKGISEAQVADENRVELTGYLCKQPIYRETPLGKEIADILIAVKRPYKKSDYIPGICWFGNAKQAAGLQVGTKIKVTGMIQSRKQVKVPDLLETRKKIEKNRRNISKPCQYPDCFRCTYQDCTCNEGLTKKANEDLIRELGKRG